MVLRIYNSNDTYDNFRQVVWGIGSPITKQVGSANQCFICNKKCAKTRDIADNAARYAFQKTLWSSMLVNMATCRPPTAILFSHLLTNALNLHLSFDHLNRWNYDRLSQSRPAARPPVIHQFIWIVIFQCGAIHRENGCIHARNAE